MISKSTLLSHEVSAFDAEGDCFTESSICSQPRRLNDACRSERTRLLLVSLLESFCGIYEPDEGHARSMFRYITESLRSSGIIEREDADELNALRAAYKRAFHDLLFKAHQRSITDDENKEPKFLLPVRKSCSENNLPISITNFSDDSVDVEGSDNRRELPRSKSMFFSEQLKRFSSNTSFQDASSNSFDDASSSSAASNVSFDHWLFGRASRYETDFEELEMLGKGGFGTVYRARNKIDGAEYALKKIILSLRSLSRFGVFQEARSLARMNHPNVIRFYSSWVEELSRPPAAGRSKAQESESDNSAKNGDKQESSNLAFGSEDEQELMFNMDDTEFSSNSNQPFQIVFQDDSNPLSRSALAESEETESFRVPSRVRNVRKEYYPFSTVPTSFRFGGNDSNSSSLSSSWGAVRGNPMTRSTRSQSYREGCHENCSSHTGSFCLFIQMALCSESLEDHIRRRNQYYTGVLPRELRKLYLMLFMRVLEGVRYLHDVMHTVHRDLKPRNVFLAESSLAEAGSVNLPSFRQDNDRNPMKDMYYVIPKIGDFGLVMEEDGVDTSSSDGFVGTGTYASPEMLTMRCRDSCFSWKTDVYALGVILFEILWPFNTAMERACSISDLKNGRLPPEFVRCMPHESELIRCMLASSSRRPRVSELLRHEVFNSLNMDEVELFRAQLFEAQTQNEELRRQLEALKYSSAYADI
ncbi:PEK protein kinase Hri1 [Schizosaccharomyces japonicus yFS275]|uniref:non-specific serine/threonine protein kinase n=1 Tax=Schizosaccharomyces japonicus (strain yFS275 / FY16936) TaxID=402676 RepID=B6JZB3_SCHJY|nr:PEK protein kinase Hri1 [Schizosaccharomyces japonicus yFS275]EEB06881.2 PEK protein kinase Hri1 [Schizosaccharomyces japonicus yFS275]